MGCNTSQELKTKDGTNAASSNGGSGGGGGSGGDGDAAGSNGNARHLENGEINGISNNERNHTQRLASVDSQTKSAHSHSHSNHQKPNSAISNGDNSTSNSKHTKDLHGFEPMKHGIFNDTDGGRQCEKADISELDDMDLGEDEAKAATKIQAVFRGHQVRSTMKKSDTKTSSSTNTNNQNEQSSTAGDAKNGAASTADPTKAELEAEFDPNDKELCDAALKIQATFRGHLARKIVNKDDAEDVDIQEITKKVAEELDIDLTDPELNKAATKIQASFRGHKTRKDANPVE